MGLNSNPEKLILGIQLSGIIFMSRGLIVVWRTLITCTLSSSPIRANTQRMDCKCTNINSPGPRERKELRAATALIELETTAPAYEIDWAACANYYSLFEI